MTKHARTVLITVVAALVLITVIFVGRDVILKRPVPINCSDGPHGRIDLRDFTTQYWAYSVELEVSVGSKAKLSEKLTPQQVQQISDTLQSAQEFRKYVVAGYNSCAIDKVNFAQLGKRFETIDGLAREINVLIASPSLTPAEHAKLANLVDRYGELVSEAGKD